ncbi:glycosyltransferase [Candidatus Uhrbacteria bacterium]|nr:glycosyltransferase [Candidatus Uhrbacteria bacterium]MBD3284234.1 glycosyltransferase [Candidatus Uhrbacteria bacterium]
MMKNAKRLLILITQSEWGGAQTYVLQAAMEAKRRNMEVLVAAGGAEELKTRCEQANIPYRELHHVKRSINPLSDLWAIHEIVKRTRDWKPTTSLLISSKMSVIGSIASRIANSPKVVYRIGGWSFLDPVSPLQKFIRRLSERVTCKLKDVIIVQHPGDEQLAKRYRLLPKQDLVVIPNGIHLKQFDAQLLPRDQARTKLGVYEGGPIILTTANFYATKGLMGYLDAIKQTHQRIPDARFHWIGDGGLRPTLERRIRELRLQNVVTLHGKRSDATQLLQAADLFVLPSVKEGMPWALLEAMAASRACIATDVGANRWMLKEAGWIVPPEQQTQLANAIMEALSDPEHAAQLARNARKAIEQRFTADQMWERTFALF